MFKKSLLCRLSFWICVLGVLPNCVLAANAQAMRMEAQLAQKRPNHVDVSPMTQVARAGAPLELRVVLRDANGNEVGALQDTEIELTVLDPRGQSTQSKVRIPKGQSSLQTTVVVQNPGLAKLAVRQASDQLLGGTNWLSVSTMGSAKRATMMPKSKAVSTQKAKASAKPISFHNNRRTTLVLTSAVFHPRQTPAFVYAAFSAQDNGPAAQPVPADDSDIPYLLFRVSGENDAQGIRADNRAYARIQVFYMGPSSPTKDIRIWLSWSNGDVDNNPLVIKAGEIVGEAHWTSGAPFEKATIAAVATEPRKLQFQGDSKAQVRFAAPILGISFANPPEKISIVDMPELSVRFFDLDGNPVQTSTERLGRFTSSNPMIHLKPTEANVAAGRADFSTTLFPTSLGSAVIEASIPGYKPVQQKLMVSGTSVLILCLLGGLIGGWLGYVKTDGKLSARMVAGVFVGLLATWAYVYIGLPNTNTAILHSQVSTLFVSLIAAVAGVKVVAVIGKAVGLAF